MRAVGTTQPDDTSIRSMPSAFSRLAELDRLLDVPSAIDPIGGRDAHEDGQAGRHAGPYGARDAQGQPHAVVEAAAIAVVAEIGERRQELVQQIAVCRMDLDHLEAGFEGARGCRLEGGDDPVDPRQIEGDGGRLALVEWHRARRQDVPAALVLAEPLAA